MSRSWGTPAEIDRTAKILLDSGRAATYEVAAEIVSRLVLQIAVGPDIAQDPAAQAALATAVNVGHRAFKGGVRVRLACDPVLATGWTNNLRASEVVTLYGGVLVERLDPTAPTLSVGRPGLPDGDPVMHLRWYGWTGAVVASATDGLHGPADAPAGVLAAALGVSQMFQHCLGDRAATSRDVGISLWQPDMPFRSAELGPPLSYLPAAVWLLGLGHLGQAYAWTLGMLSYRTPEEVRVGLMDFDTVEAGNAATQILAGPADEGELKTRVVASALARRGVTTRLVERAFDSDFRPSVHADRRRNEPIVALAGFDGVAPRRLLDQAGFRHAVDGGLGAGPAEYLDVMVHTFPGHRAAADVFAEQLRPPRILPAAYEAQIAREVAAGADESATRCGMLDIAGINVGAAFVGTVAATLVVADILRELHQGRRYSVIGCDLRGVELEAVLDATGDHRPIPYTLAQTR